MYKEKQTGCAGLCYCGKCLMMLLAVLQLVGGFFGIVTGILLLTWQWIPGLLGASNYLMSSQYTAVVLLFVRDYKFYANLIGVVDIVFGLFIEVTAIVSIVGGVKDSKKLLTASAALKTIATILLWIGAIGMILSQSAITKGVHDTLKRELQTKFQGSSGNSISAAFSMIQSQFHCCGVDGYTDYQGSRSTSRTAVKALAKRDLLGSVVGPEVLEPELLGPVLGPETLEPGPAKVVKKLPGKTTKKIMDPAKGVTVVKTVGPVTLVPRIPVTCCKGTGSYTSFVPRDKQCIFEPTDENSYWKTGCMDKIRQFVTPYRIFMLVSFIGVLLISVITVSCAWISVARAGRSDYEIK